MRTPQEKASYIKMLEEIQQSCTVTKTLYNGFKYEEIKIGKEKAYFTLSRVIEQVKKDLL